MAILKLVKRVLESSKCPERQSSLDDCFRPLAVLSGLVVTLLSGKSSQRTPWFAQTRVLGVRTGASPLPAIPRFLCPFYICQPALCECSCRKLWESMGVFPLSKTILKSSQSGKMLLEKGQSDGHTRCYRLKGPHCSESGHIRKLKTFQARVPVRARSQRRRRQPDSRTQASPGKSWR